MKLKKGDRKKVHGVQDCNEANTRASNTEAARPVDEKLLNDKWCKSSHCAPAHVRFLSLLAGKYVHLSLSRNARNLTVIQYLPILWVPGV